MKPMKALLIGPVPPPIGGDTVSTANLLASRYWGERGITVSHIDSSPGAGVRLPDGRLSLCDALRGVGIVSRVLPRLWRCDIVLLWANSRFICTAGLAIILLARMSGRPVVVKVFGALLAERMLAFSGPRRRLTISLLSKADSILPQTRGLAEQLHRELGLPAEKVVTFPNYIPDGALAEGPAVREYGGRCIFIGQVKREKGVFDIIDAVAGTRHRCDLYGPVLERDARLLGERLSGYDNIQYRGLADPDEVPGILRGYDALLLPTYHVGEGYPAVILQAFAAGVPVIASDWLSIPDLVEDGVRGLLVPTHSPGRLREALDRLAADPALSGALAAAAYEYVKSFSERAVVDDILISRLSEVCGTRR